MLTKPDVIYTRDDGTPIGMRPRPEDYADPIAYLRAFHDFNDLVTDVANKAFDREFRRQLKKDKKGRKR